MISSLAVLWGYLKVSLELQRALAGLGEVEISPSPRRQPQCLGRTFIDHTKPGGANGVLSGPAPAASAEVLG